MNVCKTFQALLVPWDAAAVPEVAPEEPQTHIPVKRPVKTGRHLTQLAMCSLPIQIALLSECKALQSHKDPSMIRSLPFHRLKPQYDQGPCSVQGESYSNAKGPFPALVHALFKMKAAVCLRSFPCLGPCSIQGKSYRKLKVLSLP